MYKGKFREFHKPVTIIWGEHDIFAPKDYAYQLKQEEFPDAAVHVLMGAGHFIHIEASERMNEILGQHFSRVKFQ